MTRCAAGMSASACTRLSGRRLVRDWWRWLVGGALLGAVLTLGALVLASVADDPPELIAARHTPSAIAPHAFNVATGPAKQVTIRVPGSTSTFSPNIESVDGNSRASTSPVSVVVPNDGHAAVGRATMATLRAGAREANLAITDLTGPGKTNLLPSSPDGHRHRPETSHSRKPCSTSSTWRGRQLDVTAGALLVGGSRGRRLETV